MPTDHHDVVVIGASSGGVDVLTRLVSTLPESLPAAIFIVLHVRPDAPSLLPAILNRAGVLPAAHAVDSERIRTGRIYVAPPGMQMYVHRSRVAVERGPRENMHRPAIDPLFRTAAHHHGSRVIGIVASGALDDGTAGLQAVKEAGGVAVVQDPADAACASMPAHAMARVDVDYCVKADALADLIVHLVNQPPATPRPLGSVRLETREEAAAASEAPETGAQIGVESGLTCPDCSGILREVHEGDVIRFRCRVGHAYTSHSMLEAQGEAIERALWTAVRQLEERAMLIRKLASAARQRGHEGVATMFEDREVALTREVAVLRELIADGRALEPLESVEPERM
jgi:two-component system, chemotaxis family, protein-glutamate methylesterase/glutaminase